MHSDKEASQARDYCVAALAQIPYGFAQGRLSLRKKCLLGMNKTCRFLARATHRGIPSIQASFNP